MGVNKKPFSQKNKCITILKLQNSNVEYNKYKKKNRKLLEHIYTLCLLNNICYPPINRFITKYENMAIIFIKAFCSYQNFTTK